MNLSLVYYILVDHKILELVFDLSTFMYAVKVETDFDIICLNLYHTIGMISSYTIVFFFFFSFYSCCKAKQPTRAYLRKKGFCKDTRISLKGRDSNFVV